jgi:hypothetical protein
MNLLVRGPANVLKDGVCPLEGIIETDWCPATFTMNWRLTRPGQTVTFEAGQPFAMLVPVRRGELEAFEPEIRAIDADPAVARAYREWHRSRSSFLTDLRLPGTEAREQEWQKDYVHGRNPDGSVAPEHQRKLSLRPFRRG